VRRSKGIKALKFAIIGTQRGVESGEWQLIRRNVPKRANDVAKNGEFASSLDGQCVSFFKTVSKMVLKY
jgi:hypothetical protein